MTAPVVALLLGLALAVVLALLAVLVLALRRLPGRQWDQFHHGWFGFVLAGYVMALFSAALPPPWRWVAFGVTGLIAAFCLLCLTDDAWQHEEQCRRYRNAERSHNAPQMMTAQMYRSPLHRIARWFGVI